ncbi:MAG: DUF6089 family protein, partial [Bacteroidota bacterium]
MVRVFVAFLLFLFTCTMPLHAQQEWDYGVHIGYSNYLGDIGGSGEPSGGLGDMQFSQNSLALGVFARKRLNHFAIKFNLNCLRIKGEDNLSMDTKRFGRNLSFRNDIIELGARVEYNFITLMDLSGRRNYRWNFDAYIFTGFSMFYHNPKGNLNGTWHSLQPLHTEGPGQAYTRLQPAIPIGIGFYFTHKQRGSIRIGKPKGLFRRTKKRRTSDVKRVHRFGLEFNLRIT